MAEQKVIAVVGATGAQGGGLVRAILADPAGPFRARAITRDPGTDKAKALARPGAEVVASANLDDPASLRRAFEGAHGAYCVTFFWDHFSRETEHAGTVDGGRGQGRGRAPRHPWSTFEDTRTVPSRDARMPTLQGKYKVPHFDGKGEADAAFLEAGVPTTFLLTSFYWENFIYFGMGPKAGPDGVLAITFPMGDKQLPAIAAEDIGKIAYGIFKRGDELIGKTVGVAGEHLTGAQMAEKLGKALGEEVRYNEVDARHVPRLRLPGCRRDREHVPVEARLRGRVRGRTRSRRRALARPGAQGLRRLARREGQAHSARLGAGLRPAVSRRRGGRRRQVGDERRRARAGGGTRSPRAGMATSAATATDRIPPVTPNEISKSARFQTYAGVWMKSGTPRLQIRLEIPLPITPPASRPTPIQAPQRRPIASRRAPRV